MQVLPCAQNVAGRGSCQREAQPMRGSGLESKSRRLKCRLAGIQFKVEKSPIGRVNVAWAGVTTRVSAACLMLPEMAATGRATMSPAAPRGVARKQPGGHGAKSVRAAFELSSEPRQTLRNPKPMTMTHRMLNN